MLFSKSCSSQCVTLIIICTLVCIHGGSGATVFPAPQTHTGGARDSGTRRGIWGQRWGGGPGEEGRAGRAGMCACMHVLGGGGGDRWQQPEVVAVKKWSQLPVGPDPPTSRHRAKHTADAAKHAQKCHHTRQKHTAKLLDWRIGGPRATGSTS